MVVESPVRKPGKTTIGCPSPAGAVLRKFRYMKNDFSSRTVLHSIASISRVGGLTGVAKKFACVMLS